MAETERSIKSLSDSPDGLTERIVDSGSTINDDSALKESINLDKQGKRRHHRSGKHRRSHRSQHWSGRSKLLFAILSITILATFCTVLFLSVWVYGLNKENSQLKTDLVESEQRLAQIVPEHEKFRKDLETLLQGRLPGLTGIEFDKVINLNDNYVRNIIFTEVHSKNETGYEFKIVLYNNTLQTIWPDFLIFFFDSHGIQVHSVKIGAGKLNYDVRVDPLAPGEIRSHTSVITLVDNNELPAFFMLRLNISKEKDAAKD